MAKKNVVVKIPSNIDALLKLIKDILDKHKADGANSIVAKADADFLQALYDDLKDRRNKWLQVNKTQEDETEKIMNKPGLAKGQTVDTPNTGKFYVTKVRDVIMANNKGNPKALGNWGFTVNESKTGGSKPPTKPE